jgi:hypothetical protein
VLDRLPATELVAPSESGPARLGGLSLLPDAAGYHSGDPLRPAVGDVRIRFAAVPVGPVTVVGAMRDGTLGPWAAPNGAPVLLADAGRRSTHELIAGSARASLAALWGARFAGGVAAFMGFALLWDRLPLWRVLGRRRGPGALAAALGLVGTAVALGWLLFRTPLLGW